VGLENKLQVLPHYAVERQEATGCAEMKAAGSSGNGRAAAAARVFFAGRGGRQQVRLVDGRISVSGRIGGWRESRCGRALSVLLSRNAFEASAHSTTKRLGPRFSFHSGAGP
jgi:hypothetical protein